MLYGAFAFTILVTREPCSRMIRDRKEIAAEEITREWTEVWNLKDALLSPAVVAADSERMVLFTVEDAVHLQTPLPPLSFAFLE